MWRLVVKILLAAALGLASPCAMAGPWEDGMAAYNRGDYVPAMAVFRGMARTGNSKALAMLGAMYRRGQGVRKSSAHAFMWLSLAASRGDAQARAELKTVSATITAEDLSQARVMMQACEGSDYRDCEY